jgi:hypothetical protein
LHLLHNPNSPSSLSCSEDDVVILEVFLGEKKALFYLKTKPNSGFYEAYKKRLAIHSTPGVL